ncbi:MAG: glutathione S-transferase family protein [Pseudomonadota bacterium]|nr:glutathione S-transferase family protein [Pseudomonadota bacterium]MEC8203182.1 glutathione S-transferase family protein [Pseudomonadota bacterium]
MKLFGGFGSPFTRRVGTTLRLYGLEHEHIPLRGSVPEELEQLQKFNPLGRVPALETDEGRAIVDSAAILDYLDQLVGPEKSLTPPSGDERTEVMNIIGISAGAVEKSISCYYEEGVNAKRPPEMVYRPWVDRMYEQTKEGVEALDGMVKGPWMIGDKLTQADVSMVCFWDFIAMHRPASAPALNCPNLSAISERANAMTEFSETRPG